MNPAQSFFFVTGGTLTSNAPSYVERQADHELYEGVKQGEFCYVLTSRQMGKSSLMVRTADRLRQDGTGVAILDLTAVGQNLTAEQWYDGLLGHIARQFNLDQKLDEFWQANARLGPLQRWMRALREVVLPSRQGKVVIFVDEIDAVRSLPFSTDEFFAAIRECYNRRTEDPEYARLTFCLLGVATPSDLIRDTRTTPFNVGRRIEVRDFAETEAAPLAAGLVRERGLAETLLQRILYWTGGHPYLTQRLCQIVADDPKIAQPADVDQRCEELFFSTRARERDDNLLFVRERMLRSDVDLAGLLDLYGQVYRARARDDETNPLIGILRLSGITRVVDGKLHTRNRIYARVFDPTWIEANMPDAEKRRQRRAFRGGLIRGSAVAGVILLVISGLGLFAWNQQLDARLSKQKVDDSQKANVQLTNALDAAKLAQADADKQRALANDRLVRFYVEKGARLMDEGDTSSALSLFVEALRADKNDPEPHRRRLAATLAQCPKLVQVWSVDGAKITHAEFSPDGKTLVTVSDALLQLWNVQSQESIWKNQHENRINHVAFSSDGRRLVTASDDQTARLWDVQTGKPSRSELRHERAVLHAAFSPDGARVITASADKTARVWPVQPEMDSLRLGASLVGLLAASQDASAALAASCPGRPTHSLVLPGVGAVLHAVFSPDGKRFATVDSEKKVLLWDETGTVIDHLATVNKIVSASSSADGRLAVIEEGGFFGVISVKSSNGKLQPLLGIGSASHTYLKHVALGPDGRSAISTGNDRMTRIWDYGPPKTAGTGLAGMAAMGGIGGTPGMSGIGGMMGMVGDPGFGLMVGGFPGATPGFNVGGMPGSIGGGMGGMMMGGMMMGGNPGLGFGRQVRHDGLVHHASFSPDGRHFLVACSDKTARVLDLATGDPLTSPLLHGGPVVRAAFSPDGRWVMTASEDQKIRLWDIEARDQVRIPAKEVGHVKQATASRDGRRIVAIDDAKVLSVTDAVSGKQLLSLKSFDSLQDVRLSGNGQRLAVPDPTNFKLEILDVDTGAKISSIPYRSGLVPDVYHLNFDGRRLVAVPGGMVGADLWDVDTGKSIAVLPNDFGISGIVEFAEMGDLMALLINDPAPAGAPLFTFSKVIVWNSKTGQPWLTLDEDQIGAIANVVLSPDGRRLVSLAKEKVQVWDVSSNAAGFPKLLHTLEHHDDASFGQFSRDGEKLVTFIDNGALVWNLASAESIKEPLKLKHRNSVGSVAFSPDGKFVATGSFDRTARVWDAVTGEPVSPPLRHASEVFFVAFAQGGDQLVTISQSLVYNGSLAGAFSPCLVRTWNVACDPMQTSKDLIDLVQQHQGVQVPLRDWKLPPDILAKLAANPRQQPAWHFHQAEECESTAEWSAAVWHLDRLLEQKIAPAPLLLRRAAANLALNNYEEALRDYGKIAEFDKDKIAGLAVIYLRRADARVAASLADKGASWDGLAEIEKDYQKYDEYLRALPMAHPMAVPGWRDLLNSYTKLGDALFGANLDEDAEKAYLKGLDLVKRVPAKDPLASNLARSFTGRGNTYLSEKKFAKAVVYFTAAVQIEAKNATYYHSRGRTYRLASDWTNALADLDEAVRLDPGFATAFNERGLVRSQMKENDRAIADFDEALRLNGPEREVILTNRGITWEALKMYDKALADYNDALKIRPNVKNALSGRAAILVGKREFAKAIADYDELIKLDKNDFGSWNVRGIARYRQREYDQAIADYTEALRIRPKDTVAFSNRAKAWRDKGEYTKALADYEQSLKPENASFAWTINDRGVLNYRQKNDDKAVADFNEAIRRNPKFISAYLNRALAYSRLKQHDKAQDDLAAATALDPKDAANLNSIAWLLATAPDSNLRNGKRAIELAKQAMELDHLMADVYAETLAAAHAEAGNFTEAERAQERAISDPQLRNDPEVQQRLELYRKNQPYRQQ